MLLEDLLENTSIDHHDYEELKGIYMYDELLYLKHFIQKFSGNTLHFCDEKKKSCDGQVDRLGLSLLCILTQNCQNSIFSFLRGELIKRDNFYRIHVNFNNLVAVTLKT